VPRDVIKQEGIVDYTYQETVVDRFAKRLGASMAKSIGLDAMTRGMQLR
jgi:protease IV